MPKDRGREGSQRSWHQCCDIMNVQCPQCLPHSRIQMLPARRWSASASSPVARSKASGKSTHGGSLTAKKLCFAAKHSNHDISRLRRISNRHEKIKHTHMVMRCRIGLRRLGTLGQEWLKRSLHTLNVCLDLDGKNSQNTNDSWGGVLMLQLYS